MNESRHGDRFYEWDGKNHSRVDGSYARRDDVEPKQVPDRLRGRTIVAVTFEDADGYGNDLILRLDDGSVFVVSGWGHDWWGTVVVEVKATEFCEDSLHAWQRKRCVNLDDWTLTERDAIHRPSSQENPSCPRRISRRNP